LAQAVAHHVHLCVAGEFRRYECRLKEVADLLSPPETLQTGAVNILLVAV